MDGLDVQRANDEIEIYEKAKQHTEEELALLLKIDAANHNIDTERFRCSCGARMCFSCGWCAGQCLCEQKDQ